jgi:type I restriction enzyme M protein
MGRSTVHYVDNETNQTLRQLHNKLRPAGTPVQRVEYIIELLLLRIFEVKLKQDADFKQLRKLFDGENYRLLFSYLQSLPGNSILTELNDNFFPFYAKIQAKFRELSSEDLAQKVRDYLVLIEEVFANSNFTNNVQGGVLHIVVDLVSQIDEQRILKTDLLGDAIESALSETGGTTDIGLYRTPDHVRQLMVGMVAPSFKDKVFDPTCGTGGFLFDAFHFVLEQVKRNGEWPGEKAHPELQSYLEKYFQDHPAAMPSLDTVSAFYREGIAGVEYLGMIRKMAAINLFIRGLNPGNIEQGDSLQMYKPAQDHETKTVILANPPFGAERDQEAYPDVWKEHAKESETTILFVKLMFDYLKKGGRCAVVVSEGFLTWDKTSARALRKMLLEEATLRAVISLPQGVFVSKQGQGAKTSILYFEKGGPTEWVWYYKIENDGFSKGINRQPIEGSQIPELLHLFTNYVKEGQIPPDTKYSFTIPAGWIKTLDPRIKETIRHETRAKLEERHKEAREKKVTQLQEQIEKGKIDKAQRAQLLQQYDDALENKIQNEIAKEIEKAHLYSFNLPNYRSDLTEKQIKDWSSLMVDISNGTGVFPHNIDRCYQLLYQSKPSSVLKTIAKLDPRNGLEVNIIRGYLRQLSPEVLTKEGALQKLDEILKGDLTYPLISIGETCEIVKGNFSSTKTPPGPYPLIVTAAENRTANAYQFEQAAVCVPLISSTGHGHASLHRLHYAEGKFALADLLCALIPRDSEQLNVKFLYHILQYKKDALLVPLMKGAANVSMRLDDLISVRFPIPPIGKQERVALKIEKQQSIISGINQALSNWELDFNPPENPKVAIKDISILVTKGTTPKTFGADYSTSGTLFIRSQNVLANRIDLAQKVFISEEISNGELRRSVIRKNDVLLNIVGASIGRASVYHLDEPANCNQAVAIIRVNEEICLPKYLAYYLNSQKAQEQMFDAKYGGARDNLNLEQVKKIKISLPNIRAQKQVVAQAEKEMLALDSLRFLKTQAENKIGKMLEEIWKCKRG